jgi:cbb3-type cytochrome c oxidase subunit III
MFGKLHVLLLAAIAACVACMFYLRRDFAEPNFELVPERQMALSPAYGSYKPNKNFSDDATFRLPIQGTIARGTQPFSFEATPLEAARAGRELTNPLSINSAEARKQGAGLYGTYCQCCHGATGMGDGKVSGRGFPAPLSFLKPQAMDMKDGEMFHILTYGKGNMPAHALQLNPTDRWLAILHVRVLQNRYNEFPNVKLSETAQAYKANCMACHGEDGSGQLLRGTKFPNLPDFSSLAWHFTKTNLEITNRIEYGDEPLMPSFRYKLSRDQILALSIYLRSFAVKTAGAEPRPALPATAAGMTAVQIFRAYCLACHNVDGKGAIVRPGMPDIPDFTMASWHTGKKDDELSKAILSGGKFMPPMKDKFTPADADKMVQFVRAFKDGKQIVELESFVVPVTELRMHPLAGASTLGLLGSPRGDGSWLAAPQLGADLGLFFDAELWKGPQAITKKQSDTMSADIANRVRAASVIYRQYCVVCHGPDGTGLATMRAALPNLPDFTRSTFHDQHSNSQLLISILDGKGVQMPANRGRVTEAQARDLILVVRSFGPAGIEAEVAGPPTDWDRQLDDLRRQFEALQRQAQMLRDTNPKQ